MHVRGRGVEGDADVVGGQMRQQAVDALSSRFQAQLASPREAFGGGVDTDHPDRFEHRAATQFVQQIGADVAGPDQCAFDLAHSMHP